MYICESSGSDFGRVRSPLRGGGEEKGQEGSTYPVSWVSRGFLVQVKGRCATSVAISCIVRRWLATADPGEHRMGVNCGRKGGRGRDEGKGGAFKGPSTVYTGVKRTRKYFLMRL